MTTVTVTGFGWMTDIGHGWPDDTLGLGRSGDPTRKWMTFAFRWLEMMCSITTVKTDWIQVRLGRRLGPEFDDYCFPMDDRLGRYP